MNTNIGTIEPAKILYFEGAGWSGADISMATVGNCRIRTAFHLLNGKAVYLEIVAGEKGKSSALNLPWQYTGFVDNCFYITDDEPNDDENLHPVLAPNGKPVQLATHFEYTERSILNFVNSLGADFDKIKVVPDLGGYRVFPSQGGDYGGPNGYYYGDEFQFDPELTARRDKMHAYIYDLEKEEGKEFPDFSMWVDEYDPGILHILRHFEGHNRHWECRVDRGDTLEVWFSTMTETKLGRYGC